MRMSHTQIRLDPSTIEHIVSLAKHKYGWDINQTGAEILAETFNEFCSMALPDSTIQCTRLRLVASQPVASQPESPTKRKGEQTTMPSLRDLEDNSIIEVVDSEFINDDDEPIEQDSGVEDSDLIMPELRAEIDESDEDDDYIEDEGTPEP